MRHNTIIFLSLIAALVLAWIIAKLLFSITVLTIWLAIFAVKLVVFLIIAAVAYYFVYLKLMRRFKR